MELRPSVSSVVSCGGGTTLPPVVIRTFLDSSKCCAMGLGFVASLYVWPDSRGPLHALVNLTEAATDLRYYYDREHPSNIRKRAISTTWVGVLGTAYLCFQLGMEAAQPEDCLGTIVSRGSWALLTRHLLPRTTIRDTVVAMGVTSILFTGVIATKLLYKDERAALSDASDDSHSEDSSQNLELGSSSTLDLNTTADSEDLDGTDHDPMNDGNNPVTRVESFAHIAQPKGPAIHFPKAQRRDTRPLTERRRVWQILRNFVICPLVEEILFRAVMWKVVTAKTEHGPLNPVLRVGILSFAFGVSHMHHVLVYAVRIHQNNIDPLDPTKSRKEAWKRAFIATGAQVLMTSVFSLFNTFVYTRLTSQNILVSALVHSYVNYLGPPSTAYLYRQDPFIRTSRYGSVDSIALNERAEAAKKPSLKRKIGMAIRRVKRAILQDPLEWRVRKKTNVITGSYYVGIALFGGITIFNLTRRK